MIRPIDFLVAAMIPLVFFQSDNFALAAPLIVTNGDFSSFNNDNAFGGGQRDMDINSWDENGDLSGTIHRNAVITTTLGTFGSNPRAHLVRHASQAGWIAQSLGTYLASDGALYDWSYDVGRAARWDGNTVSSENTMVSMTLRTGSSGGTAVFTYTDPLSYIAYAGGGGIHPYVQSGTVDLAALGVTNGTNLWIRFDTIGPTNAEVAFDNITFQVQASAVPEPSALALGALGLIGLGAAALQRRKYPSRGA